MGTSAGTPGVCAICGRDAWRPGPRALYGGAFLPCECQTTARLAEIAAEEESGTRRFEVDVYDFSNPELEAFYTEVHKPGGVAMRPCLPEEARRARELEARGYYLWTARLLRGFFGPVIGKMAEGRFFMYRVSPKDPEDVPRCTVRAIRCVIEKEEPGWVEAVAEAQRCADHPGVIAAWCEIPVQAVLASLDVLAMREGGEARASW